MVKRKNNTFFFSTGKGGQGKVSLTRSCKKTKIKENKISVVGCKAKDKLDTLKVIQNFARLDDCFLNTQNWLSLQATCNLTQTECQSCNYLCTLQNRKLIHYFFLQISLFCWEWVYMIYFFCNVDITLQRCHCPANFANFCKSDIILNFSSTNFALPGRHLHQLQIWH